MNQWGYPPPPKGVVTAVLGTDFSGRGTWQTCQSRTWHRQCQQGFTRCLAVVCGRTPGERTTLNRPLTSRADRYRLWCRMTKYPPFGGFVLESPEKNNTASVMLVDDHPLLRKGVRQLIELTDNLEVVAEARQGEDAVRLGSELDLDVVLLELNMQGMDGLETLTQLRAGEVTSRIVMLTVSDADEDVIEAVTLGADGYLLKDMEPEQLLEQIERALQGKMVMSDAVTHALALALRQPQQSASNKMASLTAREAEVLNLIAQGLSNKLIARELDISDGTVKVHVKHLLKKLGLRSRVEAAVWMVNQEQR